MARREDSPGRVLLSAQQAALSRDGRLDTLSLTPLKKGVPALDVGESVVAARAKLTIEGASTVEIEVSDPDWQIESSGLLDTDRNGRMEAVAITLDKLRFRLVQASRNDPYTITLTFEDEVVAMLRAHTKPLAASRGSVTRAQFVERLVREVKARDIGFYSPERDVKQKVKSPEYPDSTPAVGETGFDDGARVKIKGQYADSEQMRQMSTALGVAQQENASARATLALVVAGIGESTFRPVVNSLGYGGVFQGQVATGGRYFKKTDTAAMARYFLRGGKGFQGGGAIKLARENPKMSVGEIATTVEGSGQPGSFYQRYHDEAAAIISAYGGSNGDATSDVVRVKSFQFTRGKGARQPGEPREDSWKAMQRLAEDVAWRCFAVGGVVSFVSDVWMKSRKAGLILQGPNDPRMLEPPTYDWDHGKLVKECRLRMSANNWSVEPGGAVLLHEMGPLSGGTRWIVHTFEFDLLDATSADITLTTAQQPKREPAADVISRPGSDDGTGGDVSGPAGAQRAVKWARSKIGSYKEDHGQNRGAELDDLERELGFVGAAWCAIFATKAAVYGGAPDSCRTAQVAQIREWTQAGTHGYQQGFKASPQPGDLMCFGTAHVALVEKVHADSVTCIDGNSSAGQVARSTRVKSSGVFCRPDYPN